MEAAEFVPIAGLAGVARTLLSIWQAICLVNAITVCTYIITRC